MVRCSKVSSPQKLLLPLRYSAARRVKGKISPMRWEQWAKFTMSMWFACLASVPKDSTVLTSTPDNKDIFLRWEKLHQIALGVARGIEYRHHGCEQQILHFDINPHNVLLGDNFTPKITDFGLAKLCSRNQSAVSMTAARGTLGCIAPEVVSRNFGNVSYKSDIYSYGMLLLEIVGGRKNDEMPVERHFQVLYWNGCTICWMENILIEDEEDVKIAKKMAVVGLWCIQWHPGNRPSIKTVIQMLEGDGDKLTVPHNLFHSTSSTSAGTIITRRCQNFELEVIDE